MVKRRFGVVTWMAMAMSALSIGCLNLRADDIDDASVGSDAPEGQRGSGSDVAASNSPDAGQLAPPIADASLGTMTTGDGPAGDLLVPPVTCSGTTPNLCGSACVDLKSDGKHCGRCDLACDGSQTCAAGRCTPGYDKTIATAGIPGALWDLGAAPDGSFFVAGIFKGTVDFDAGPNQENQTATGADGDIFVSKFNADGGYVWTRTLPAATSPTWVHAATAIDGSVLVSGYYRGTMDFLSAHGGVMKTAGMANADEAFVLKIQSDGGFGFVRTFPAVYSAAWHVLGMHDGTVIVVGAFQGPVEFGDGSQPPVAYGGYVTKLAATGATVWSRAVPGGPIGGAAEAATASIVVTGNFTDVIDLDPGAATVAATAGTGQALFVIKLDSDGKYVSGGAAALHGKMVIPTDVTTTDDGSIYAVGRYSEGALPMGPGANPKSRLSAGDFDAFVSKFSPDGTYQWGRGYGGPGYDQAWTLTALPDGGVAVAGTFDSPMVDFGAEGQPDVRPMSAGNLFVTRLRADGSPAGTFVLGLGATPSFLRPTTAGFTLAGFFSGMVDFNPRDDGTDTRMAVGHAGFLSRYRL
jgi:hypothetical protein